MTLFMGRDISTGKWKEWEIQAYIVQEVRRAGYFIEGDQNQAKRSYGAAARAKACGMQAGTPDLRLLLPKGKIVFIELKIKKGRLSPAQLYWHSVSAELGHTVWVSYCASPAQGWEQVKSFLEIRNW